MDCLRENIDNVLMPIQNAKDNVEMEVELTKEIVKRHTEMEVKLTEEIVRRQFQLYVRRL